MRGKRKYILSIIIFVLLFGCTFYYIFSKYSFKDFWNVLITCNPIFIGLAVLCVFGYLFFEGLFFKSLFKEFKEDISWWQAIGYVCTEIYFSAVTPSNTGGQPVQMVYMARDGIPYRKSTVVVLLNTMLYKLAITLFAIVGILCFPKLLFQNGWLMNLLMVLGFLGNILIIGGFGLLLYTKKIPRKLIRWLLSFLSWIHLLKEDSKQEKIDSLEKALDEYHECALFTKRKPRFAFRLFFYILLQRFSLFLISYVVYRAFGLSGYSMMALISLQIAITLATDCVPFPGGVMVAEGLTYHVNVMIFGSIFAISSMLLIRGIGFYFLVFMSGIIYAIYHFTSKKKVVKLSDRNL